ncbi:MAG: hypothetical protein JWL65_802 [Gammaproteobacteria bacterium]|jgi:hypothetical protein|nr:hypothetical protein [Gammaproteobacteria bacterium]
MPLNSHWCDRRPQQGAGPPRPHTGRAWIASAMADGILRSNVSAPSIIAHYGTASGACLPKTGP